MVIPSCNVPLHLWCEPARAPFLWSEPSPLKKITIYTQDYETNKEPADRKAIRYVVAGSHVTIAMSYIVM